LLLVERAERFFDQLVDVVEPAASQGALD